MVKIGLAFKKPVNFKNGYIAEWYLKTKVLSITDISKDWQMPLSGTKDIGNPKIKKMSFFDLFKTFKIDSITIHFKKKYIIIPKRFWRFKLVKK